MLSISPTSRIWTKIHTRDRFDHYVLLPSSQDVWLDYTRRNSTTPGDSFSPVFIRPLCMSSRILSRLYVATLLYTYYTNWSSNDNVSLAFINHLKRIRRTIKTRKCRNLRKKGFKAHKFAANLTRLWYRRYIIIVELLLWLVICVEKTIS